MADNADSETRAGAFSSVLAGVLVIALTVMAFVALEPAEAPSLRIADVDISLPKAPSPTITPQR